MARLSGSTVVNFDEGMTPLTNTEKTNINANTGPTGASNNYAAMVTAINQVTDSDIAQYASGNQQYALTYNDATKCDSNDGLPSYYSTMQNISYALTFLTEWNKGMQTVISALPVNVTETEDNFIATAGQTVFTLAHTPNVTGHIVNVYRNGVRQKLTTHYTRTGAVITLLTPAVVGELIDVTYKY